MKTLIGADDPDPYRQYRQRYTGLMTSVSAALRRAGRLGSRRSR